MGRVLKYRAGSSRVLKKSRVVGGFGSGRSVEIFHQVFPGTLYLRMGISRYYGCFGYFLFFGGSGTNEFEVSYLQARYKKSIV